MHLTWDKNGLEDYQFWQKNDLEILRKINWLIKESLSFPYLGSGLPKPTSLETIWTRKIIDKHRLVYAVEENTIKILQCRFHD